MTDPSAESVPPLPQEGKSHSAGERTAGRTDNIDLLKALFLGAALTGLFYEVFPVPFIESGRLLALFDNRVSEVITGMTFWSLFILLFKYRHHRGQLRAQWAFGTRPVQAVFGGGIYARDVEEVLEKLRRELRGLKLKRFENSVIFRRVHRLLRYIRGVPKKESLNELLDYQAQIEVKRLETSYTILQVFIWAIPILGFIGTVLGIGQAVSEFSIFIQTAEGGAQFGTQMRTALGGVTSGLAVAFNTTFLALVLVIPVMILTSFLHKNEEELLLEIEEYFIEELLPLLHITPSSDTVTENFDEHMHRILQLSSTWLGQFEPLVEQLSQRLEMVNHQIGGIQPVVQDFTDRLLERGQGEPPPPPEEPPRRPPRRARADPGLDGE